MVAIEQNMLYIIIAVIMVVIILLAVFIRRRGRNKGPKNVNQYLAQEAKLKKMEIVEQDIESKPKSVLLKKPQDKLNDIRKNSSQMLHKIIYSNSKMDLKGEPLQSQQKPMNLRKQLKKIDKKNQELNERVKES